MEGSAGSVLGVPINRASLMSGTTLIMGTLAAHAPNSFRTSRRFIFSPWFKSFLLHRSAPVFHSPGGVLPEDNHYYSRPLVRTGRGAMKQEVSGRLPDHRPAILRGLNSDVRSQRQDRVTRLTLDCPSLARRGSSPLAERPLSRASQGRVHRPAACAIAHRVLSLWYPGRSQI